MLTLSSPCQPASVPSTHVQAPCPAILLKYLINVTSKHVPNHVNFLEYLDGVEILGRPLPRQVDAAIRAFADRLDDLKVSDARHLVGRFATQNEADTQGQ